MRPSAEAAAAAIDRVGTQAERRHLERFRLGDPAAFDDLVRQHADAVYRFALRLTGRAHEAEDVAQETFARALNHAREFRAESGFRTWLFRIAINLERDAARRRSASPVESGHERIDDELGAAADSVHETDVASAAESRERLRAVRAGVERLPRMQRETLILRVYEDLPYSEVALILGISVGAAKMNVLYARKKLASWLGDESREDRHRP
jgi:RNA polymerase sigma-70 factor (ECF subfamily)